MHRTIPRFRDRAALCCVSRSLNKKATRLLYQHTIIELDNTLRPRSKPEFSPPWLTQLRGLYRDRKTLCPVITKLSILFANESDVFERGESLAMDLLLGCVREMHSLDEVIWASNPVPPGDLMEAFAAQNITAFTYDGDPRVTKLAYPLDVLKLDLLSQCPLRSLSIKASTEPELLGLRDAIFTHRKSLESLALRFGDWATWYGYLVFRTGYPDCAPKSVLEGEGDPTFVLFEPFVQASEKLCLQSFDLLGTVYYGYGFSDSIEETFWKAVDVGCLKHLQISRRHSYRTVQGTLLGEWQDYHSLESLAFEGKPLPNRAGSQDSQDSWDEIAARLTSLSVDQFIPHLGHNFSSLRMLAMTMPLSPSHLPIPELKAVCPLLEQLAYVQPPGLFTRDLPDLEGMPHLRRVYAMVDLKSSIVMDYFARFMEYCCKTESPLLDRLDRFAGGVTVCDIVSVRQLEWSLRLPLNVQEAEAEAVHENENAELSPYIPLLPRDEYSMKLPRQTTMSCRGKVFRQLDWRQLEGDPMVDTVMYRYNLKCSRGPGVD
ncbi:predicted protein [Histoplasma capsulatum G186AR]|uniref:Uncharacterized protein n=1 Tax=Ajellomyces capsulatus (strain G186AR / H82 / ATCC MYA-2454 / RMSCC 2432) TaxID=447093 RepID=C0NXM3_AJECG|nr:uncharacterized protein HCBG_08215 [Histoplasma capsulatum G186AR]EEH04089.1 predicted protein [Histoplasma capsulatum G186AR]